MAEPMQRKTLFRVVPEGWFILAALAVLAVVIGALAGIWLTAPVFVVMAVVAAYCRDTPRSAPAEPLTAVAPVDGTVRACEQARDPFLDRAAVRVSIRVSWWSTYLLRSPVEGTILELDTEVIAREGSTASWIRTDEGDELVLAMARGSTLGQPPCRSDYGARVGQGRCCGFRRFGRRVDLYLPIGARLDVAPGSRVRAGTDVLAKLVHKQQRARPIVDDISAARAAG